jgi:hypothetical protein
MFAEEMNPIFVDAANVGIGLDDRNSLPLRERRSDLWKDAFIKSYPEMSARKPDAALGRFRVLATIFQELLELCRNTCGKHDIFPCMRCE